MNAFDTARTGWRPRNEAMERFDLVTCRIKQRLH